MLKLRLNLGRSRWFALGLFLTLVIVGVPSAPSPAATQGTEPAPPYTSPTWGYEVRWPAAVWTVVTEESSGRTDILELIDENGVLARYEGTDRYGDDPATCRSDARQELDRTPGISDIEIVPTSGNPTQSSLAWYESPSRAYAFYVYRLELNGVEQDWLTYVECQSLVFEDAVLKLVHTGPADPEVYDFFHAPLTWVAPARQSLYPRSDLDSPIYWSQNYTCDRGSIEEFVDDAIFGDDSAAGPGSKYVWFRVRFYNDLLTEAPDVLNAETVSLIDRNDFIYPPLGAYWLLDGEESDQPLQELAAGTGAILLIAFELPTEAEPATLWHGSEALGCVNPRNGATVRPERLTSPVATWPGVSFVMSRDGNELGFIIWHYQTSPDNTERRRALVSFENSGTDDWSIDPANIRSVVYGTERTTLTTDGAPEQVVHEERPDRDVVGPIQLAPGERTTLLVTWYTESTSCTEAYYLQQPDQAVPIGGSICGAGAGGSRPSIRTGG